MTICCMDCHMPIPADEMPVVITWGPRLNPNPVGLGRPIKEAIHVRCDLIRKGKTPVSRKIAPPEPTAKEKAATTTKEPSEHKQRHSQDLLLRIFKKVKGNPRKEGTHGWKSFNLVKDGMTVEQYLAAGGRKNDLAWDVDHKFVELRGQDAQSDPPPVQRDEKETARPKAPKVEPAKKSAAKPSKKPSTKKPILKKKGNKKK